MVIHIVTDILTLSPKLTDILRATQNWLELLFRVPGRTASSSHFFLEGSQIQH